MHQKQYIIYLSNKICLFVTKVHLTIKQNPTNIKQNSSKKEIYCNDFGSIQSKR